MTEQLTKRRPDPFDGSAGARLCRMGLLTAAGDVAEAAMQVCTHIFAASFFISFSFPIIGSAIFSPRNFKHPGGGLYAQKRL